MNTLTPSPSDLSIFSHNDEELDDEDDDSEDDSEDDASPSSSNSNSTGDEPATERASRGLVVLTPGDEEQQLSRELLDALYLGTSNFLLAYNTRAGIGVLLRIFKLLQKRQFGAIVDPQQLLDEKHLSFRVEAVSMGLFLGWFTGGYRGLKALFPRLIKRLAHQKDEHSDANQKSQQSRLTPEAIEEISTLLAGACSASALFFVNAKRRRSLALYALARALQCGYNTAKRRKYWHFWGSQWRYGDALLFALSSAQVMYAFIMRPSSLPGDYFRFIQKTGPVEREVLEMVRLCNRGLPLDPEMVQSFITKHRMTRDFVVPVGCPDQVSCRFVHHQASTCTMGVIQTFRKAFGSAFPLYLSLFIVPSVVIHFKKFLARPFSTLGRSVLNATRSNAFVSSFVAIYMGLICVQRRVMPKDHRFTYYLAGLGASGAIFIEPKSRRSELALYVLPRALDSLFIILRDRRILTGVRHGEVLLFSLSMACMMYSYEHEKDSMGSFLHSTLKRFLQTATDKKKIFLANLEHQQQRSADHKEASRLQA
ncbi:hypothetical protein Poli38472_007894 [Pythium oligandrum]|uniref:Transmembrane protein 135 N-terminal domain-containing protein n=1 Tax=Pythium oligandrum TaxID=41045 RepID=A0A8K1FQR3_PYTOL|nr:hypothetical protein Poli38472_007894 [Pythium oligandrum]|eukprot:TMW68222.1 hypothetical protein Poli38472_007894 [Pythium oligandrum]